MWQAIYDYFLNLFQYIVYDADNDLDIGEYLVRFGRYVIGEEVFTNSSNITTTSYRYGYAFSCTLPQYLALICSLIVLVIIFVLCCLFIYRLIRLVGRLFSGGAL